MSAARKLDVLIPTLNRPAKLHALLRSGLALDVPGLHLVVIDDGSTVREDVPGLGAMDTRAVCESFADTRIVYIRNDQNIGLARSWERYHESLCDADYVMSVVDKDEFVDAAPIVSAMSKLEADDAISMVMIPLRQHDRKMDDRPLLFDYPRMSGREFLRAYVRDSMLQHGGMYGILRVAAARRVGLPRPLGLRRFGLDDGFGIDVDFILNMARTGDFDFENVAHVRRSIVEGGTERYPLTFAYTYYQYAKRALRELERDGWIDRESVRIYTGLWMLLICRGLHVALRPMHGSEREPGTDRISGHLRVPLHLYVALECLKCGLWPEKETRAMFVASAKLLLKDRLAKLLG
jgi:glycosyltransferase involved in cell wall biosynthesis